ncbi:hypothetical protein MMC25_007830 [Agyrium rufum]|nr:hypothetical protein [Agyrium rufum]
MRTLTTYPTHPETHFHTVLNAALTTTSSSVSNLSNKLSIPLPQTLFTASLIRHLPILSYLLSSAISHVLLTTTLILAHSGSLLSFTALCLARSCALLGGALIWYSRPHLGAARTWLGLELKRMRKEVGRRLYQFKKDCTWAFLVWLMNPNAVLLLVFWPGWLVLVGLWFWYSFA